MHRILFNGGDCLESNRMASAAIAIVVVLHELMGQDFPFPEYDVGRGIHRLQAFVVADFAHEEALLKAQLRSHFLTHQTSEMQEGLLTPSSNATREQLHALSISLSSMRGNHDLCKGTSERECPFNGRDCLALNRGTLAERTTVALLNGYVAGGGTSLLCGFDAGLRFNVYELLLLPFIM